MIRYLLLTVMIMLTPPKGNGGLPHAPSPAVVEARVWDKLAAALSFVESKDDDRAYNASSGALGRWQMKRIYVDEMLEFIDMIFGHTDMIGEGEDDTE